mgnify:CR=1 FL=1
MKSAYWSIDTEYNNTYDRYKYDKYGNWIERIRTVVKNSKIIKKTTETRKITYWE